MFEINWSDAATHSIKTHPLYLKYKGDTVAQLAAKETTIKADLDTMEANAENVYIIAYYSWLLRLISLRSP